jgi:hypothetical protein
MKRAVTAGNQKIEEKRRLRELREKDDARKAEEGKFDGLVKILRYLGRKYVH